MTNKTPEQERLVMGFVLPDLLGKPFAVTDSKGNLHTYVEIPKESYLFSIPIKEWMTYSNSTQNKMERYDR
ncbi:hypothetical protein ES703_107647 [subsurface metagenome]